MNIDAHEAARAEVAATVPDFRCGDDHLTRVARLRWGSFIGNLVATGGGWVVTEFRQPGPGRAHGTVNAAAGHHILEGRWLGDQSVIADYVRFWFEADEAEPHRYTEWITWAALEFGRLHGREGEVARHLPGMIENYRAWERDSLHPSGLYWAHDLTDAMEFSVSGDGLRPSINSYQAGNAAAIAELARIRGDRDVSDDFEQTAEALRSGIVDSLWDDELQFFRTIPMSPSGEAAYLSTAGVERRLPADERRTPVPSRITPDRRARELIGYLPWYFGIPGDRVDPEPAVRQLVDEAGFAGARGLTTVERRHPRYRFPVADESPRFLCRWNGPSWPFATSQTLTALARIAREHSGRGFDAIFVALLRQYAASHIEPDGSYWLDEDLDPDSGEWITRAWRRRNQPERAEIGRDYQHSTFADLLYAGLLGVRRIDAGVAIDPLPAASALDWFEVERLRIGADPVSIAWSPERGLSLTVRERTARRSSLGPLEVTSERPSSVG